LVLLKGQNITVELFGLNGRRLEMLCKNKYLSAGTNLIAFGNTRASAVAVALVTGEQFSVAVRQVAARSR
jgi:hypothetical protein